MKAAVQVLRQADELKKRVTGDVLNDNDAWSSHQQLQNLYQQFLVSDLEFALDKKVEQDLWNYVFKNQINSLQNQTKNKKNPRLVELQDNLTWFLGAASGFYLELLQELCETFDLDLSCRRKGSQYGITRGTRTVRSNITRPHQHSCLYICQHCLVHLGDIARYRNQSRQAEAFYHHAAQLIPTNGQPYNQLAILEAAKGDKLSTVFYYVRSIAVKFPFPVASTNLQKMFSKIAIDGTSFEGKNKLSVYDYVSAFLQFHALAHLASNLAGAECLVKPLSANIMTLVATESLTGWKLTQMVTVNLFALTRALRGLEMETDRRVSQGHESLTEEEQTVYTLILELMSSMLNGLLLLVYTMQDESALVSYYALPVINVILGWLRLDPTHLKTAPFTSKLQIWPSLCKLLNGIITIPMNDWNEYKYVDVPLPEDWDLQGFLPLSGVHSAYKFKETARRLTEDEESKLRITRLIGHGKWLCEQEIYGVKLMAMTTAKDGAGIQFEAVTQQTPSVDLLMQLEEMSICSRQDAKMADANNGQAEDEDFLHALDRDKEEGPVRSPPPPAPTPEERTRKGAAKGIIGNARGDRKTRQNVAMQTIVQRKNMHVQQDGLSEEKLPALKPKSEGKQVTFKTPSPSPPASSGSTPPLPTPIQHQQQQQPQHVQYPAAVTMGWANGIPHTQTPMYPHYYQNFPSQKAYYQQQDGNMVLGNQTPISNFGGPTTRDATARFNYVDQEGGGPMSYSKAVIQGRSVSPAFLNERPPTANFNMMPPNIKDPATCPNTVAFGNRPATGPGPPPLIVHGPPPNPPSPPPPILIPGPPPVTPSSINLMAMQQQQFGFPSPPPSIMPNKPGSGGGLWRPQWQPAPHQASPPGQMSWLHQFPPPPTLQQQQTMKQVSLEHMMAQAHQQGNIQGAEANAANQVPEGPEVGRAQYMYHLVQQQQHNQFAGVNRPYHLQAAKMVPPQHAIWGGAVSSTAGGGGGPPPPLVDKLTPPNQQPQHTGLVTQLPTVTTTAPMAVAPHYPSGGSNRAREEYCRASASDLETDSGGKQPSDILESNTYSLFSSSWSSGLNLGGTSNHKGKEDDTGSSNALQFGGLLQQGLQSLWSSSGPTPLEQLLEQQKRKREPVTK